MLHIVVDNQETKAWIKQRGNVTTDRRVIWNKNDARVGIFLKL